MHPSIADRLVCTTCGEENPASTNFCILCALPLNGQAKRQGSADPEIQRLVPGGFIRDYRLVRKLGDFGDLLGFIGVKTDSAGARTPVVVRLRPLALGRKRTQRAYDTLSAHEAVASSDTIRLVQGPSGVDHLHVEYDVLANANHPAWPAVVDYFEENEFAVLVQSAPRGAPLFSAWSRRDVSEIERVGWLEQIRQAVHLLHQRDVIFPTMQPNRIVIDAEGKVRIRDAAGLTRLPLSRFERAWQTHYSAPELFSNPTEADWRSDAYTFGALVYALSLGRELNDDDFLQLGSPRPFVNLFPEASPALVRLLGKTFVSDPRMRFPTARTRQQDPSGFEDVGDALAEHARTADSLRFDIAGWSNTGILRDNNEDCFTISNLSSGAADFRRDLAMICLADGMGGLAGGEIASSLAVSAVSDFLRERGLSSAGLDNFGPEHLLHDPKRANALLEEAVHEANRRVYAAAQSGPIRTQMGCTLEAILLIGRFVALQHVGDSRVYHSSGEAIRQVTVDQTLVNRLVERGELTLEEAEVHPYRSAIVQAIGAQMVVDPAAHLFPIAAGDWLIVCSDGLTNHLSAADVLDVLRASRSADSAARRLLNHANMRGGADNCTVIAVLAR